MSPPRQPAAAPTVPLRATLNADGSITVWAAVRGVQVPLLTVGANIVRHYLEDNGGGGS